MIWNGAIIGYAGIPTWSSLALLACPLDKQPIGSADIENHHNFGDTELVDIAYSVGRVSSHETLAM